jgi:hypothetical protein
VEKEDMARNAQSHPRQLLQSLLAAVLLFNTAQRARASVTYQYVAGQGTYTTTQGNIIGVPIYLQETLTSGSTSLITAASFPGGYFVLDSTTAGSTSSQRGDNIAGNLTGPGGEPNVNGLVLLGTAYIQASSVAAGVATFSVGAYSPGNGGYTQTFTAPTAPYYYDLDLNNNGTASGPPVYNAAGSSSFEVVTIVPEPTSIQCLAGGLAASLGCGCRARRGRPPRCVERISALR